MNVTVKVIDNEVQSGKKCILRNLERDIIFKSRPFIYKVTNVLVQTCMTGRTLSHFTLSNVLLVLAQAVLRM